MRRYIQPDYTPPEDDGQEPGCCLQCGREEPGLPDDAMCLECEQECDRREAQEARHCWDDPPSGWEP